MQIPLEITFRGMAHSPAVEARVRELAERLERVCGYIGRCHVAIERPHRHPQEGSGFRVRLDITVPPNHEIVVRREPAEGSVRDDVYVVLREAFEAARRQLAKLTDRQRGRVKVHAEQEVHAVVTRLFADHGFLMTVEGREVYFHANSVLGTGFDGLKVGAGVAFTEEPGIKGPQASSVRVLDRRGEESLEPPPADASDLAP
jgi:cold shock CspA family protein/ribosome-associated translation inhibitor RaiA